MVQGWERKNANNFTVFLFSQGMIGAAKILGLSVIHDILCGYSRGARRERLGGEVHSGAPED
jgi:hypothetical protein